MRRWVVTVALILVAQAGCTGGGESADPPEPTNTEQVEDRATLAPSTSASGPDFDDVAPISPGAGGEATGPLGSTEVRIDTDAGTVQIGSGSVPTRLGSEFPLPDDFVVQLASETDTDLGFSGTTDWSFDDLFQLYEAGLPAAGYRIESVDRRGSEFAVFEFTDDVGLGQVAISQVSGGTGHTVIVAFGDGVGDESQLEN